MKKQNVLFIIVTTLLASLIISACGSRPNSNSSDAGDSASSSSAGSGISAMPTAKFESVGAQSGITTTTDIQADGEEDDGADVALGERVYANKCAECHGPSGEGSGDAPAVVGTKLSFADFEDLLRTGGDIGPEHLFGTQAVSANGVAGLHAYLTAE